MVIITNDSKKIQVKYRIFFKIDHLEAIDTEKDEMISILYEDIKYIDSNNYQNINIED